MFWLTPSPKHVSLFTKIVFILAEYPQYFTYFTLSLYPSAQNFTNISDISKIWNSISARRFVPIHQLLNLIVPIPNAVVGPVNLHAFPKNLWLSSTSLEKCECEFFYFFILKLKLRFTYVECFAPSRNNSIQDQIFIDYPIGLS